MPERSRAVEVKGLSNVQLRTVNVLSKSITLYFTDIPTTPEPAAWTQEDLFDLTGVAEEIEQELSGANIMVDEYIDCYVNITDSEMQSETYDSNDDTHSTVSEESLLEDVTEDTADSDVEFSHVDLPSSIIINVKKEPSEDVGLESTTAPESLPTVVEALSKSISAVKECEMKVDDNNSNGSMDPLYCNESVTSSDCESVNVKIGNIQHVRLDHTYYESNLPTKRNNRCIVCGLHFDRKVILNRHRVAVHNLPPLCVLSGRSLTMYTKKIKQQLENERKMTIHWSQLVSPTRNEVTEISEDGENDIIDVDDVDNSGNANHSTRLRSSGKHCRNPSTDSSLEKGQKKRGNFKRRYMYNNSRALRKYALQMYEDILEIEDAKNMNITLKHIEEHLMCGRSEEFNLDHQKRYKYQNKSEVIGSNPTVQKPCKRPRKRHYQTKKMRKQEIEQKVKSNKGKVLHMFGLQSQNELVEEHPENEVDLQSKCSSNDELEDEWQLHPKLTLDNQKLEAELGPRSIASTEDMAEDSGSENDTFSRRHYADDGSFLVETLTINGVPQVKKPFSNHQQKPSAYYRDITQSLSESQDIAYGYREYKRQKLSKAAVGADDVARSVNRSSTSRFHEDFQRKFQDRPKKAVHDILMYTNESCPDVDDNGDGFVRLTQKQRDELEAKGLSLIEERFDGRTSGLKIVSTANIEPGMRSNSRIVSFKKSKFHPNQEGLPIVEDHTYCHSGVQIVTDVPQNKEPGSDSVSTLKRPRYTARQSLQTLRRSLDQNLVVKPKLAEHGNVLQPEVVMHNVSKKSATKNAIIIRRPGNREAPSTSQYQAGNLLQRMAILQTNLPRNPTTHSRMILPSQSQRRITGMRIIHKTASSEVVSSQAPSAPVTSTQAASANVSLPVQSIVQGSVQGSVHGSQTSSIVNQHKMSRTPRFPTRGTVNTAMSGFNATRTILTRQPPPLPSFHATSTRLPAPGSHTTLRLPGARTRLPARGSHTTLHLPATRATPHNGGRMGLPTPGALTTTRPPYHIVPRTRSVPRAQRSNPKPSIMVIGSDGSIVSRQGDRISDMVVEAPNTLPDKIVQEIVSTATNNQFVMHDQPS